MISGLNIGLHEKSDKIKPPHEPVMQAPITDTMVPGSIFTKNCLGIYVGVKRQTLI
jgi:hypothetical protein